VIGKLQKIQMLNNPKSLRYNSLLTAFVLVTSLFVLFSIKNYRDLRNEKLHSLELRLNQNLQTLSQSLAIPLWNLDEEQIRNYLNSLKNDNAYCGTTIRDNNGDVIIETRELNTIESVVSKSRDIFYRFGMVEKKIGEVELCYNRMEVKLAVMKGLASSIIYSVAAIILIMIFINISLNKILKPIEKIRTRISEVSNARHKITEAELLEYSEIELISKTFNQMVDDLNASDASLIAANQSLEERVQSRTKELNEYKDNLEKIVQERIIERIEEREQQARFEASKSKNKCNIPVVIEKSLLELKPLAEIKNIKISTKYNLSDPEIKAQEGQLLRVFVNIISNSIKFSDKGSAIHIMLTDCSLEKNGNTLSAICIKIEDDGQGIDESKLELIFDKDVQSSKTGAGLGLSLCKEVVEAYNGTIIAENNHSKGTTITVILPR
jgi:signal transduction histidine kinase